MVISTITKYMHHPSLLVSALGHRIYLNWLSDEMYLKIIWWVRYRKRLEVNNPCTFNEKLQWLKLYDRRPEYTKMVDKYRVKNYVGKIIGDDFIIPTLAVWDRFEDIDFDKLPNHFVLKCTHDSGGVVICRDKNKFKIKEAEKKIKKHLKRNYYWGGREWPYKNVKPRIIAEQYLDSVDGLVDYKLMCFNGEVKCLFVCTRRLSKEGLRVTFYDLDWNIMPFTRKYPKEEIPMQKPYSLDKMVKAAQKISSGYPFMRVDFYEIDKKPLFGEITLYPGSGMEPFSPKEWDYTLGSWINLPV